MKAQSRTSKSIHNSIVAMGFFALTILLQFVSRKVFLDYLGTEILGLNTTASNLLQFLNLAELGIGAAVGFSLYKPLAEDNRNHINEIVTLQGMLYRRIATAILIGAGVLMCFFPLIFKKMALPMWYAYGSFGVLLVSALIGYYVNYRQIVLASAQMDYKIQWATNPWMLAKLVAQIVALKSFSHPYEWWLGLEFLFSLAAAANLHYVTKRTFPYLRHSGQSYKELKTRHHVLIVKIRQLFVHKIGSFVMSQFSPLIIYAYLTLTAVAYYGNYMMVVMGVNRLCNAVFNSMGAGIGNLVAEADRDRILAVFSELMSLRFAFVSVIVYTLGVSIQPFIALWFGQEYLLGNLSMILIMATMFINLTRNTVDLYVSAYGLFGDIWAPLAEAALNIGSALVLGHFFGLNGILCGVLVSLTVIILIWKPYYLFHSGMRVPVWRYWYMWGMNLFSVIAAGALTILVLNHTLSIDPFAGWWQIAVYAIVHAAVYAFMVVLVMLVFTQGFRLFVKRVRNRLL